MTGVQTCALPIYDKKTAYLSNSGGSLSAIDLVSRTIKTNGFSVGTADVYEPVVAPNGSIFVGSKNGFVYNVNESLTAVNWSYKHSVTSNTYNFSHPCVDSENRFYITTGGTGNTNYIFSANGDIIDSWQYEVGDNNQKQMGGNNYNNGVFYSAFIGSSSKNGLFIGKYVGGERATSWSTHGGDICGSCCIK